MTITASDVPLPQAHLDFSFVSHLQGLDDQAFTDAHHIANEMRHTRAKRTRKAWPAKLRFDENVIMPKNTAIVTAITYTCGKLPALEKHIPSSLKSFIESTLKEPEPPTTMIAPGAWCVKREEVTQWSKEMNNFFEEHFVRDGHPAVTTATVIEFSLRFACVNSHKFAMCLPCECVRAIRT